MKHFGNFLDILLVGCMVGVPAGAVLKGLTVSFYWIFAHKWICLACAPAYWLHLYAERKTEAC